MREGALALAERVIDPGGTAAIRVIGLPAPVFWSQRSIVIDRKRPTWSDGPVQS
jgi:hypothetical protein